MALDGRPPPGLVIDAPVSGISSDVMSLRCAAPRRYANDHTWEQHWLPTAEAAAWDRSSTIPSPCPRPETTVSIKLNVWTKFDSILFLLMLVIRRFARVSLSYNVTTRRRDQPRYTDLYFQKQGSSFGP